MPSPPLGATWTGSRHQLGTDWQNWSWGTTVNPLDDGMQITFDQGWAGFQVNTDQPVLASQLVLNVDRQMVSTTLSTTFGGCPCCSR